MPGAVECGASIDPDRRSGSTVFVRAARREDVHRLFEIIDECAATGSVLPRTVENIALTIESFFVGEVDGRIVGCCALVTCGPSLAEIRSVATAEEGRGLGVARAVVEYAVIMGKALEFERLFLLTKIPRFFERIGFALIDPAALPDSFIADLVHAQKRSLFNKSVMMRNLTLDADMHSDFQPGWPDMGKVRSKRRSRVAVVAPIAAAG
jgi:N-acetylglutamate synthase-like GNAT family acetyltransferase